MYCDFWHIRHYHASGSTGPVIWVRHGTPIHSLLCIYKCVGIYADHLDTFYTIGEGYIWFGPMIMTWYDMSYNNDKQKVLITMQPFLWICFRVCKLFVENLFMSCDRIYKILDQYELFMAWMMPLVMGKIPTKFTSLVYSLNSILSISHEICARFYDVLFFVVTPLAWGDAWNILTTSWTPLGQSYDCRMYAYTPMILNRKAQQSGTRVLWFLACTALLCVKVNWHSNLVRYGTPIHWLPCTYTWVSI